MPTHRARLLRYFGTGVAGPISQITLTPSSVALNPTATTTTVTGIPRDAVGRVTADTVTYHSSNTSAVTINSSTGVCTYVAAGSSNITATSGAITSNTVVATAVAHGATSQVVMSPTTLSLPAGTTSTVTGTAKDSLGNATGDAVTYSSNNTPVATVNSSTGLVTWASAGSVTITATSGAFSATCVVTAAAAGATVQIAGAPGSLSLAHGTTGTFSSVTPEDISGVATGTPKYWHSSDSSIVRIDDATTGAYTVLGTAAQTVTITVNLVAPVTTDEPFYTTAVGQTLVQRETMAAYAGLTAAQMRALSTGSPTSGTARMYPVQDAPLCAAVSEPILGGAALKVASNVNGGGGSWSSGTFSTVPPAPVANQQATHFMQYDGTITSANDVPATPFRVKWLEGWHPGNVGRQQWDTTNIGPPGTPHLTHWSLHDQAFSVPAYGAGQVLGPWWESLTNDGLKHRFTYQYRCNTPDPGTVNVLIQTATIHFETSQTGVIAIGNYIQYLSGAAGIYAPAGTLMSTAEFQITGFDGDKAATITRVSTGHTLTTYSGGIRYTSATTQSAVFSQSRAGAITNGNPIAINGTNLILTMSAFDGTTGCTIDQLTPNSGDGTSLQLDYIGVQYSTTLDGISRMWIDGVKVLDVSRAAIGNTPTGGEQVYATLVDVATIAVNSGVDYWHIGEAQTEGSSYTFTFNNLTWWVQ